MVKELICVEDVDERVKKIRKYLRVCIVHIQQIKATCPDHPHIAGNFPYPECLHRLSGHRCPLKDVCEDLRHLKEDLHGAMAWASKYLEDRGLESFNRVRDLKEVREERKDKLMPTWPGGEEA